MLFGCLSFVKADELNARRLASAWVEYGYQNWRTAEKAFELVENDNKSSAKQKQQAAIGLASIVQYRVPGNKPKNAISLYEKILSELGSDKALQALILTRIGGCHIEKDNQDYEKARLFFREAIAIDDMTSLPSQEAALSLISSYMLRPLPDEYRVGIKVAEELLPKLDDSPFASVAHGMVAKMAFWVGDLPKFEKELVLQEKKGISSRSVQELALFQIARLNEIELNNPAKAAIYYRRLQKEIPTSTKAYWAGLQADKLKTVNNE